MDKEQECKELTALLNAVLDFGTRRTSNPGLDGYHYWREVPNAKIAEYIVSRGYTKNTQPLLPCKIGDKAWIVRGKFGRERVSSGLIACMYYRDDMQLMVGIYGCGNGIIGENIFLTPEEAQKALEKIQKDAERTRRWE